MRRKSVSPVLAAVLLAVAGVAGCDEGERFVTPAVTGAITGTVTINGAGAAGVTVTLSIGLTATTGATGQFTFNSVPNGAYTITISGYPSDVAFTSTTQAAVIAISGQSVTVNFAGTRGSTSTHTGRLSVIGGNAAHDQFVFNAGGGKDATLALAGTDTISITPSAGFSPSSLPTLTGTRVGTAVTASGSGTIAGVTNVSVTASGTLTNGRLDIEIVVGADGRLSGGQPIRYRFVDN